MRIGIFSKYEMCGGSELRCIEMANAISIHTGHTPIILCEKTLSKKINNYKNEEIEVIENIFLPDPTNLDALYSVDSILIVNTDCKEFSKLDYWEGKTSRHNVEVDVSRIPQMVFLYNFLVSPSKHLHTIAEKCDVRIITTNKKFFEEITKQDRYEDVRHLPRMILESPINTNNVSSTKIECDKIRIGRHSLAAESKFNKETIDLIKKVNKRYGDEIQWDFMGVPGREKKNLQKINNVTVRKEFSMPVPDYLNSIDIFLFFVSWGREEPWSRAVAEAIASGCPILATDKGGNKDQVVHGNNGFLCRETKDFYKHIVYLMEHREKIKEMGQNSLLYSRFFSSEYVVAKFIKFIGK